MEHPGLALEHACGDDLTTLEERWPCTAEKTAQRLWVALERPAELERCPDCDERDDCELRAGRCEAVRHPRLVVAAFLTEELEGALRVHQLWIDEASRRRWIKKLLVALRRLPYERLEVSAALLRGPERLQSRRLGYSPAGEGFVAEPWAP